MQIPAAAIAQGVGGILKLIGGNSQRNKGQRIINEIGDSPDQAIPNEVLQNQAMAKQRANTGLPSEQYARAMRNITRQQLMTLKGSSDRRGGLTLLPTIQQNSNDAQLNLDVADANARVQNERALYGINNNVASWKNKIWANNVRDKWNRKYQYGMSLLGSGNQNSANGTDQLLAGTLSGLSGINWGRGRKTNSGTGEPFMDRTDFDTFN